MAGPKIVSTVKVRPNEKVKTWRFNIGFMVGKILGGFHPGKLQDGDGSAQRPAEIHRIKASCEAPPASFSPQATCGWRYNLVTHWPILPAFLKKAGKRLQNSNFRRPKDVLIVNFDGWIVWDQTWRSH
jgi:hypothetical protein